MCDNILECFWDKWMFVGVCEEEWVKKNSNPGSPGKMWAHFKCNINWFNDIVWILGGCVLGGTFELFYQKHNFETLYISKIKLMNLDQIDFYKPSLGITFWMYVTSK